MNRSRTRRTDPVIVCPDPRRRTAAPRAHATPAPGCTTSECSHARTPSPPSQPARAEQHHPETPTADQQDAPVDPSDVRAFASTPARTHRCPSKSTQYQLTRIRQHTPHPASGPRYRTAACSSRRSARADDPQGSPSRLAIGRCSADPARPSEAEKHVGGWALACAVSSAGRASVRSIGGSRTAVGARQADAGLSHHRVRLTQAVTVQACGIERSNSAPQVLGRAAYVIRSVRAQQSLSVDVSTRLPGSLS